MADTASTQKQKPTGFFDLPLELRQMVYEQLYPARKGVELGRPRNKAESEIIRFCQADTRIREEIISWESKRHSMVLFTVIPEPWHQPEHFHYQNLDWIVIFIDYYDMDHPWDRIEDQLDDMRTNMEKIVATIATYQERNQTLPRLYVKFRQEHRWSGKGDKHWCRPLCWDECTTGDLLDTVDGTLNTKTIFEYLLEPLLELPTCRRARIKVLENLSGCTSENLDCNHSRVADEALDHDHWYAKSFCEVMEAWLEGRISRVMPFVKLWNKYRLAWLRGCHDPTYESMWPIFLGRKRYYQVSRAADSTSVRNDAERLAVSN